MKRTLRILIILLLGCATLQAQNLKTLRDEMYREQRALDDINRLIDQNRSSQKTTSRQLKLTQSNITQRKAIVRNLNQQIGVIEVSIADKSSQIKKNEATMSRLRGEYAKYIYEGYKSTLRNDAVAFLFASTDFNDATRRLAYIRYAGKARRQTTVEIDSLSRRLAAQVEELDAQKQELAKVKDKRNAELSKLKKDENSFQSKVSSLKKSESNLSSKAQSQRKKIQAVQKKIDQMIAAEAKRKDTRTKAQRDADVKLTGLFGQNRGKLPYPVRGGVIIDHFGQQKHHLYSNLTIDNGGVNIAGSAAAQVKCVFDGEVRTILSLASLGQNTAVLVRHGDYFTVYQNLVNVTVKVGDKVTINQVIGQLPSTGNEEDQYLHFEIWQGNTKLNPESWLNR